MGVLSRHREVVNGGKQRIIDIAGDEIEDGSLALVEVTAIGVEGVDGIVVVHCSTPAPVEVELVVALAIAAAYKSVSAIGIAARIIQREVILQVADEHLFPFGFAVEVAFETGGVLGIAEIIMNGSGHILRVGTGSRSAIHHVDRHTAMVHQSGHSLIVGVVA